MGISTKLLRESWPSIRIRLFPSEHSLSFEDLTKASFLILPKILNSQYLLEDYESDGTIQIIFQAKIILGCMLIIFYPTNYLNDRN